MRTWLLAGLILLLAGNTTGCDSSGPDLPVPFGDFTYSVSTFQCGPADGPATAVLLARSSFEGLQPADPYVRVSILRAAAELQGTSWSIGTSLPRSFGTPGSANETGALRARLPRRVDGPPVER